MREKHKFGEQVVSENRGKDGGRAEETLKWQSSNRECKKKKVDAKCVLTHTALIKLQLRICFEQTQTSLNICPERLTELGKGLLCRSCIATDNV